jgi:hypothetical protein
MMSEMVRTSSGVRRAEAMAEGYRKLVQLPPLRLTAQEIAHVGDELAAQVSSGGDVDVKYDISFEDGTTFSRDSSSGFLANLSDKGERIREVQLNVTGWTPLAPEQHFHTDIAKGVWIQFRDFGSQFHVSTTDPLWGKGAVETIRRRLQRHRPWYSPLLRAAPALFGLLLPLPPFFIAIAVSHERQVSALLVAVVVLSASIFIATIVLWRRYMKHRSFANTVIVRERRRQDWRGLGLVLGAVAFAADIATLAVLLIG